MSAIMWATISDKTVLVYQDCKGQSQGYPLSTKKFSLKWKKKVCNLFLDYIRIASVTLTLSDQSQYCQKLQKFN